MIGRYLYCCWIFVIITEYRYWTIASEEWRRLVSFDSELKSLKLSTLERLEADAENEMELEIQVDPEKVLVKINKYEILAMRNFKFINGTMHWDHSGVHLLVISEMNGTVLASKLFKTNQPTSSEELASFINNVQDGRVLLFVGVPEWLFFFDMKAAESLEEIGFQKVGNICNGETWIGIVIKGTKRHLADIISTTAINKALSSPLHLFLNIRKIHKNRGHRCKWHNILSMNVQRDFCQKYEGYGELCSCDKYFDPAVKLEQEKIRIREAIPIVIVTATKPHSLYRLLRNLFTTPGASQTSVLIVSDGYHQEIVRLAKVFKTKIIVHRKEGEIGKNTRTNTNIRFALIKAFEFFQTDKVILLEEDLILSPDFIRYFQETSWLLDKDPTLYCVNAFSHNSLKGVSQNSSKFLRVEGYPWYGWMVKKQYAYQVASHWVKYETGYDWDRWLLREDLRRHRDVLIPEVSRIFHSGGGGAHVTSVEQYLFFNRNLINSDSNTKYQSIESLLLENYLENLRREISKAEVVTLELLEEEKIPVEGVGPFVTFIKSGTSNDEFLSFETIQKSLKTYFWDVRENFRGVMIFNLKGRTLYVVGCPMSLEFCPLNPEYPKLINPSAELIRLVRKQYDLFEGSLLRPTVRKRVEELNLI